MKPMDEVHLLIRELDSLTAGEDAAAHLVSFGVLAIEPLRTFLLEGTPRKIFQPRLWAVKALARLNAKEALLEYLLQKRNIADPQDRFGEETVESAAARSLAAGRDEKIFQFLMRLSDRRMLNGLIETLAEFKRPETIPYFERALEDDFYRPAAEEAFPKLGKMACHALAASAVTPRPNLSMESASSLQRRRSAMRLLNKIGTAAEHWQILRRLVHEPDKELVVSVSKIGMRFASHEDRKIIAHRLIELVSSAPWHLQENIEEMLVTLKNESMVEIADEIARRHAQQAVTQAPDERLLVLIRVRDRFAQA